MSQSGAVSLFSSAPVGPSGFTTSIVSWLASVANPRLTQQQATSGAGQNMVVQAQAAAAGSGLRGGQMAFLSGASDGAAVQAPWVIATNDLTTAFVRYTIGALLQFGGSATNGINAINNIFQFYDTNSNLAWTFNLNGVGASNISIAAGVTFSFLQPQSASGAGRLWSFQSQAAATGSAANGADFLFVCGAGDGVGTQGRFLLNASGAGGSTNPWAWTNSTITTPTTGTITLTAAQYSTPRIRLNLALTGNIVLVFPNVPGSWRVDLNFVTFNAHTIAFQSGATTSPTIASATSTSPFVDVETYGGNTISVGTL